MCDDDLSDDDVCVILLCDDVEDVWLYCVCVGGDDEWGCVKCGV